MSMRELEFLKVGTDRQRRAYWAIVESQVFEVLSDYSPTLAGTIPIDVDIEGSDLDILCQAADFSAPEQLLRQEFGGHQNFSIQTKKLGQTPSLIGRFERSHFLFEIVFQDIHPKKQNAYVHMLVEQALLELNGDSAKQAIRQLKRAGLKTEPAFAKFFKIPGDAYATLFELRGLEGDQLQTKLKQITQS